MATITATSALGAEQRTLTETTLDGSSDGFTYTKDKNPYLLLRNPTGGAISPVIDGDGGTTVPVPGIGDVDVSGGYAVGSIAAGAAVMIPLVSIDAYLQGTVAITSGSTLVGALLEH